LFAARLCGVEIEILGDKPNELANWLWDVRPSVLAPEDRTPSNPHARPSRRGFSGTLYKTDAFLEAHPFGTVPAAFGPEGDASGGAIGIFESNSILRAVARAGDHPTLYGTDGYEASRIDSFLDANLVFAREAQVYLLALQHGDANASDHNRMAGAYEFYLSGVEAALERSKYLAGENLTIADISFGCDFAQFLREGHYDETLEERGLERISQGGPVSYPRCFSHLYALTERTEFSELKRYLRWYRAA